MVLNVFDKPVLIFAHAEEIVAFLAVFGFGLMIGTLPVNQFLFHVKAFAAHAVVSFIRTEINISRIVDFLQDVADGFHVVWVRGADEIIVGDGKLRPQTAKLGADAVGVFLRGDACFAGGLGDFIAVLIRSRHKKSFAPRHAGVSRQNVGDDGGVGMADMRRGVHVINGCRNIKWFRHDKGVLLD